MWYLSTLLINKLYFSVHGVLVSNVSGFENLVYANYALYVNVGGGIVLTILVAYGVWVNILYRWIE